jgi:VWFA-related protein
MSRAARLTATLPLLSTAAAVVLAVTVHGQQSPTYKLEVDVIPVDLVVIDPEGRPVPGLRPDDFQVMVDGQPRKVVTAQFLSSAAVPARQPDAVRKGGWEIDAAFESVYVGNHRATGLEKEPSRSVVIAIDQNGFGTAEGRTAANAARALLDVLHPNDRVGLAVFPPPGPFVRPTRDHHRVRLALGQVTGSAEPPPRTDFALNVSEALAWSGGDRMARDRATQTFCSTTTSLASCEQELDRSATDIVNHARRQSVNTIRGLEAVMRASSSDGSAVAIVLISTGVFATGRASQLGVDGDVRTLGRQAAASRAMVYALHVDSGFLDRDSLDKQRVSGFSTEDRDLRRAGLQYIAGTAGGTFTNTSLGSDAAFRRLSLDLAAYYLLGVEGVAADRDGRRHRLQVTVSRPGVTARTREDLYVPAARRLTGDEAVREALGAPDLERELPIRLATQMMREPGTGKVRLLISAAIGEGVQAPAPVRVGYLLQGSGQGATAGLSDIQSRTLAVVGSGADAALSYVETAQVNAGRYLLRLAAIDEKGQVGSVQQVVDSTLIAGDVGTFSDILLVDPLRSAKDVLTPVPDGRITGDFLEAFLEIYPSQGHSVAAVASDISDTPGGPAIQSGSVRPDAKGDRQVAGIRMELRALPPGLYMLNARVLEGDRALGRTSRPFLLDRPAAVGLVRGEPRAPLAFAATGRLVKSFSRDDALKPDALAFFLNRMHASETASTGETVAAAADALRGARFDAVLAALPGPSDVLSVAFLKGLALFGQGRLEPAAEQFRIALRISSDFLPAAFYLGACYAAGGRDREAVGAWQTSLVTESDSRLIYEVLADALLRLNDGAQADAIIGEARERWPEDDSFAFRLAAAKVLLNRRAEALGMLESYIERHPDESEALFLALRLLYEAHDGGKRLKSAAEDRALAAKYGAMYAAAGGPNAPLVARWVGAMTR